jgi:Tfp pilus assembly protein FimT
MRRGVSFVELTVVSGMIGVVALLALTSSAQMDSDQTDSVCREIATMIEFGQSLAIARADKTFVIKIAATNDAVWLAENANTDLPIDHPISGQPYIIQFDDAHQAWAGVRVTNHNFGADRVIVFDSTGMIDQDAGAVIELSMNDRIATMAAAPISGRVSIHDDTMDNAAGAIASAVNGAARADAANDDHVAPVPR